MAGYAHIGVHAGNDVGSRSSKMDFDVFMQFIEQCKIILDNPAPFDKAIRAQIKARFGAQFELESDYWVKNTLGVAAQEFTEAQQAKIEKAFPGGIPEDSLARPVRST